MIDQLKATLQSGGTITFSVKVRPQAQKTAFRKPLADGTLKIDLAAVAEDGEANEELVKFLAAEFRVQRSAVEIVSGQTSRQKIVRIIYETAHESL